MRGFSLLEILIAGTLFAVVFFVLMALYPSSLMSMRKAHDLIAATNVAQYGLDSQLASGFNAIPLGTQNLADQTVDGTVFHSTLAVTLPYSTVKDLQLTVTWSVEQASASASPTGSLVLQSSSYKFTNP